MRKKRCGRAYLGACIVLVGQGVGLGMSGCARSGPARPQVDEPVRVEGSRGPVQEGGGSSAERAGDGVAQAGEAMVLEFGEALPGVMAALRGEAERSALRFRVTEGEDAGKTGTRVVERRGDGGARVAWIVGEVGSEPEQVSLLTVGEDGGAAVTRVRNADRERINTFEPALLYFPRALEAGRTLEREADVSVASVDEPGEVQHRGSVTKTLELVGTRTIDVAGQQVKTVVVREVMKFTFGPASVRVVTDRWYSREHGLVREAYDETVNKFILGTERRGRTIERLSLEHE